MLGFRNTSQASLARSDYLFDGLASALNTQFVLRLRYSQPDI
jgi:hypothetical protein